MDESSPALFPAGQSISYTHIRYFVVCASASIANIRTRVKEIVCAVLVGHFCPLSGELALRGTLEDGNAQIARRES